jgi:hypothetical protein
MLLECVLTCPHCATAKSETMPTDACRYFYLCTGNLGTVRGGKLSPHLPLISFASTL